MNQMRELLRQTKDDEALIADLVAIEAGTYVEVASPHVPQSLEWREDVNEAGGEYDRSYACHTLRGPGQTVRFGAVLSSQRLRAESTPIMQGFFTRSR